MWTRRKFHRQPVHARLRHQSCGLIEPGRTLLESIQLGDLPSVGMVMIDGVVRRGRSRNTPRPWGCRWWWGEVGGGVKSLRGAGLDQARACLGARQVFRILPRWSTMALANLAKSLRWVRASACTTCQSIAS